jgi:hypothetical protein
MSARSKEIGIRIAGADSADSMAEEYINVTDALKLTFKRRDI